MKTAKTGQKVDIPIFPMLREELERARTASTESEFCFPAAAAMYQTNPDGITWRVKQVLARAFEPKGEGTEAGSRGQFTPDEVRGKALDHIDRQRETSKARKMRAVLVAYLGGQNLDQVMASTGCSRGAVSGYLNELERETGCQIVRGKRRVLNVDGLRIDRENGKRRASVHDFHSFRVTWITLALAAGVPLELVQRVTGHRTVGVVMKHYFRPGREDFRQVLLKAMPKMLSDGGDASATQEMGAILKSMKARTT